MARKTSFYYSFLVLPASQRRAIVAVWDFCRAVDDAVDEEATAAGPTGRAAVSFWRSELARCYAGTAPATPQGRQLMPFVRPFNLPREAFEDVIDGVAMDLDVTRYQTFGDLFEYAGGWPWSRSLHQIFGCESAAASRCALNLGVALQLTNIIRDVKDDLALGRVYLPLEDLDAHGCTVADLDRGIVTGMRELLASSARGSRVYRRAVDVRPESIAAGWWRRRSCGRYFETPKRIERRGYDVFGGRVRVPKPRQAAIALKEWLWVTTTSSSSAPGSRD
jgi:phytoene synthase